MLHALIALVALVPPLQPGQSITQAIAPGETHDYTLELTADQFLLLHVDQHDVDVVVTLLAPDGTSLAQVDALGTSGAEVVARFNDKAGAHTVRVTPFDAEAKPGRFTIEVDRLEPAASDPPARIDQLMSPWARLDSPGASVAVVKDGEVIHTRGYGSAQLEYGIPITPDTVFHIASISKQFAAFAVTMLAKEGRLTLDDDVRTYIPEIPDFGYTITLRHLIHHTSGLRDQWNLLGMAGWRLDDVITRDHILTLMSHQEELNFEPGERHLYCNTGYTLLGEVVARVTGQSFDEWTRENMFEPLGMENTHFHDDHERVVPNRAYSYKIKEGRYANSVLSYANAGATSLFTTANDLARWSTNFETAAVGGMDAIEQMYERCVLNSGQEIPYAFGLSLGAFRGVKRVAHGGADAGFRSYFVRFPEHDLAVIVLSNFSGFDTGGTAFQIAEMYLGDDLEALPEAEPAAEVAPVPTFAVDPETLDDYTGTYQLSIGAWLNVERRDTVLRGWIQQSEKFELIPVAEDAFMVSAVNARVNFGRDEAGKVGGVTVNQGGQEVQGERKVQKHMSLEEIQACVGRYSSEELGTFYEIVLVDEKLVARHRRTGDVPLSLASTDEFTGNSWYFGRVRFERDDDGAVIAMYVSNGRVRNVKFVRE